MSSDKGSRDQEKSELDFCSNVPNREECEESEESEEGSDDEVDRITEITESRGRGLFNFAKWLGAGNSMRHCQPVILNQTGLSPKHTSDTTYHHDLLCAQLWFKTASEKNPYDSISLLQPESVNVCFPISCLLLTRHEYLDSRPGM